MSPAHDVRSGIPDADALAALAEVTELGVEPGTAWSCSNSHSSLMGQAELAATGSTLAEFLTDEVSSRSIRRW